jgi:hypothetical protein
VTRDVSGRPRKHYVAEVVIRFDELLEMEQHVDDEPWGIQYGYDARVYEPISTASTYSFKAKRFTLVEKPGKKLQQLVDLGYTETEGVHILDALGEESKGD